MKPEERERIVLPPQPVKPETQEAVARLQRQCFVELESVRQFHAWLDDKRQCRQACRVIGDSRTGKTIACDAYRLKYATQTASGDAPTVPVIYWHATTETGQRELFVGLLEHLKYRITNGTISDLLEFRLSGTVSRYMKSSQMNKLTAPGILRKALPILRCRYEC